LYDRLDDGEVVQLTTRAATKHVVAIRTGGPALSARNKSSGATDVTLHGVLALVRLLARDAAREALADRAKKEPARPDLAMRSEVK
jgi:hypothetical protein